MKLEKTLLKVLNKKIIKRKPIWIMRQAGRYLPEYREVRANFKNFLEFCFTPEAAALVTIQPLKRFDLDAAIIFSDILVIPHALGVNVEFKQGEGPVLEPVNTEEKIKALSLKKPEDLEKVYKALRLVKEELKNFPDVTLIGFAGSPWTVACYMVQGKSDQKFESVRDFARANPQLFQLLMDKLIDATSDYLREQLKNGAEVLKLFDSWAGVLSGEEYRKFIIEPNRKIIENVRKEFPDALFIGFPRNSGELYLEYAKSTNINCLALDQNASLSWIIENMPHGVIQGNFDNLLLATSKKAIKDEVEKILRITNGYPHIFNLGHGVLPETPIENVQELIESIRNFKYEGGE